MNREYPTDSGPGLICAFDLDAKGSGRPLGWDDIRQPQPPGVIRWVHVDFSQPAGRQWLENESGIADSVVYAMLEEDIRSRTLQTNAGVLSILRGVNLNPGSDVEDMVSVRVWVENSRIVTARRRRVMSVLNIRDEIVAGHGPVDAGEFLTRLIGYLGDRIAEVIDKLDASIEKAEADMETNMKLEHRGQLANLRRKTAHFRRYLAPQREALDRLSRIQNGPFTDDEMIDLHEETNRLTLFVEELDLARERAMVAQEELLSNLAVEQNSKMYLLSIVAAIFLPLSFLTGLFGMNVAGLPGTEDPTAFLMLVALMVGIGAGIMLIFRWKKWL